MRQYIETCLRNMTGFQGQFSKAMERFWLDAEAQYKACGVPMLPQNHIPLWWSRAVDQEIRLEASIEIPVEVESRRIDGRSREARAMRALDTQCQGRVSAELAGV